MSQLSTMKSILSGSDQSGERISEYAGFGSIFGIIAAVLGLLIGKPLVPIASLNWVQLTGSAVALEIEGTPYYHILVGAFMGLMALNLLYQAIGSRQLGSFLGSGLVNVIWVGFIVAAATSIFVITQFGAVFGPILIPNFLVPMYLLGSIFVIAWQLIAIIYTDSSKTWIGFLAGLLNALFIPILALGQALSPLLIYAAYGILLVGQFVSLLFWWSTFGTIREYARSPPKAKFAFGVSGVILFLLGLTAVLIGPVDTIGNQTVWYPWSTLASPVTYQTNPVLIFGLLAFMMYWIMLAPRLGARELKAVAIGEDIIKGGSKYLMIFLVLFGLLAAGQAGARISGVGAWGFFLVIAPAGVLFLVGASYTAKTDIITGIPMVLVSVILMIHPFTLFSLMIIPWVATIITQFLLMGESWIRGLTGFSQGALTVLVSLAASITIIIIMLGGLGSGPLALWPTNRWFNITMIPGISPAIQGPTIIVLPLMILLIRNVSLAGYSYGRGYATGGILVGASVLFSFMIPVIAGNVGVTHEANTGAAFLLALYSISVVLVLTMNLNLANEVEDEGHGFEGTLIKIATLTGLAAAAIVVVLVLIVFAGIPTPEQIAIMVSIMVVFVVSTEILSIISWLIAGVRLGMLRKGFSFVRLEE